RVALLRDRRACVGLSRQPGQPSPDVTADTSTGPLADPPGIVYPCRSAAKAGRAPGKGPVRWHRCCALTDHGKMRVKRRRCGRYFHQLSPRQQRALYRPYIWSPDGSVWSDQSFVDIDAIKPGAVFVKVWCWRSFVRTTLTPYALRSDPKHAGC